MSMLSMREQAGETAADLLVDDPRVAIVLAEISTTQFGRALQHDPSRAINVGIMEQTMVGVAAGFAMEGFLPIVHTITPFLVERPLEQIKLDFGYQGLEGTFVSVGGSYDYTAEGFTHHAPGDVQAMLTVPGMQVLVPGTAGELDRLFRATYANGHPTYLRPSTAANAETRDVQVGRLEVIRRGARATVLAVGPMLDRTLAAVEGLDVTVLYVTSVAPFDAEGLARESADGADGDRGRAVPGRDARAGDHHRARASRRALHLDRGSADGPAGVRNRGRSRPRPRPRCRRDPGTRRSIARVTAESEAQEPGSASCVRVVSQTDQSVSKGKRSERARAEAGGRRTSEATTSPPRRRAAMPVASRVQLDHGGRRLR